MNDGPSIGQFGHPFRSTCDIDWPPALRVHNPSCPFFSLSGPRFSVSSLRSQGRCQSELLCFPGCLLLLPRDHQSMCPCQVPWLGRSLIFPGSHPVHDLSGVCRRMRLSFLILPLFEASRRPCLCLKLLRLISGLAVWIGLKSTLGGTKLPATQSLRRLHFASRPISTSASHHLVVKCLLLVTVASAVDRYRVWWDTKVEQAITSRSHRRKTLNLP